MFEFVWLYNCKQTGSCDAPNYGLQKTNLLFHHSELTMQLLTLTVNMQMYLNPNKNILAHYILIIFIL